MSYNLTFMNSSTNLLQVMTGVNDNSGKMFFSMFIIVLWIGLFLAFRKEESLTEWVVSSFITTVFAVLLMLLNLVDWYMMLLPFLMMIGSLLLRFFTGSSYG